MKPSPAGHSTDATADANANANGCGNRRLLKEQLFRCFSQEQLQASRLESLTIKNHQCHFNKSEYLSHLHTCSVVAPSLYLPTALTALRGDKQRPLSCGQSQMSASRWI